MSEIDVELIDLCGLSISEVADLFGRSRQAIYTGMSATKAYFKTAQLLALVEHAKQTDSPTLPALIQFIEKNYRSERGKIDKGLILPGVRGTHQILEACRTAVQVAVMFNENREHLDEKKIFGTLIRELLKRYLAILDFSLPSRNEGIVTDLRRITPRLPVMAQTFTGPLVPIILVATSSTLRGFVVGRLSAEETDPNDTALLWKEVLRWGHIRPRGWVISEVHPRLNFD